MFVVKKMRKPNGPAFETHLYRFKKDAIRAVSEQVPCLPPTWVKVTCVRYDVLESIPGCSVPNYAIHSKKQTFREACRILQAAQERLLPFDSLVEYENGENSRHTGATAMEYIAPHFIIWPSHKRYPKEWQMSESFSAWE